MAGPDTLTAAVKAVIHSPEQALPTFLPHTEPLSLSGRLADGAVHV